jgi:glyoxylase-like metal-dependent hydrolase (beta-lactamase superfamily II)
MTHGEWTWTAARAVRELGPGIWQIDLGFQDRREIIAAYLLQHGSELALIETGPASTVEQLRTGLASLGLSPEDISTIAVTHIHLDHAGAAGVLARMSPRVRVHVHPFGAPHLIDPSKLVASATRIYGDQMQTLWGEIAPIPADQVVPLDDGSTIEVAGRSLRVIFTPGHAWHHVALHDPDSGFLFTGDAAGIRMPGDGYICPPTPPPDLDPEAWSESLRKLQALDARTLCLTHFGTVDDPAAHLAQVEPNLHAFIALAEASRAAGEDQAALTTRLHELMRDSLGAADLEVLAGYELATPSYMAAMGLTRLLKKREERLGLAQ